MDFSWVWTSGAVEVRDQDQLYTLLTMYGCLS